MSAYTLGASDSRHVQVSGGGRLKDGWHEVSAYTLGASD